MDDPIKNLYVLPARGNGKSILQAQIYEGLLKGENIMFNFEKRGEATFTKEDVFKAFEVPATVGVDLAKPEPKAKEEWVWVKGYKGTDKHMQCRGLQYELGGQFDYAGDDSEISICHRGLHFCKKLSNVFAWYKVCDGNRFFEVEALVRKSDVEPVKNGISRGWVNYNTYLTTDDKLTSKSIRFIRELSVDEVFAALGGDTVNWSEDMKKRAMETSIENIRAELRTEELVAAGYSQAFAKYISGDIDECKTALAVASLPDVSMDVKVMAIFLENNH